MQPARGVPELQGQLMKLACGHEAGLLAADEVKRQLAQLKLPPYTMELVAARLHCGDCLARTAVGVQILSSCLGGDVRRLCEPKVMRVLKAFWHAAEIDDDGGAPYIDEAHAVFVVDKPLGKK